MSFKKHVALSPEEYTKLRESKNQSSKLAADELKRPSDLLPLTRVQDDQTNLLLSESRKEYSPEVLEARYNELATIASMLKRKMLGVDVDAESQANKDVKKIKLSPATTSRLDLTRLTNSSENKSRKILKEYLTNDLWNDKGELVESGQAVPGSDMVQLLDYATSNWSKKYKKVAPAGAEKFSKILEGKKVPWELYGTGFRQSQQNPLGQTPQKVGADVASTPKPSFLTTGKGYNKQKTLLMAAVRNTSDSPSFSGRGKADLSTSFSPASPLLHSESEGRQSQITQSGRKRRKTDKVHLEPTGAALQRLTGSDSGRQKTQSNMLLGENILNSSKVFKQLIMNK